MTRRFELVDQGLRDVGRVSTSWQTLPFSRNLNPADYQSAIQQTASLRYGNPASAAALVHDLKIRPEAVWGPILVAFPMRVVLKNAYG